MSAPARPFEERPLWVAADRIQRLLVIAGWFLLATLPFWLALVALVPHLSNLPLFALAGLTLGPALSASLYAALRLSDADATASAHFRRGYRLNAGQALAVWLPLVVLVSLGGANVGALRGPDATVWLVATAIILAAASVVTWNALALVSSFSFRTRDVARLAVYYAISKPIVTLATLALTVGLLGLVALTNDWVPALCGSLVALALARLTAPVREHALEHFTRADDEPDPNERKDAAP